MKKSQMFLLVLAAANMIMLLGTGCTTYHRDAGADYLERPGSIPPVPYYTEYDISAPTNGDGKASVLFWIFQFSDGKYCQLAKNPRLSLLDSIFEYLSPSQKAINNAKSSALYNACEKNSADQIFGATFQYKITDYLFYAAVECSVKGYPAKVKSVKMLEKQPVILNQWQKIEYLAPYEIPFCNTASSSVTPPDSFFNSFVK